MTIQDRILAYLAEHPEGVDDDTPYLGLLEFNCSNV